MKNFFIILVIALSISNINAQSVSNEQSKAVSMKMDHSHLPIAVPSRSIKPALSLVLNKDAMSGYNLHLKIQSYNLIPPPNGVKSMDDFMSVSIDKKTGYVEGHAHLYINGIKIQRVYGVDIHLPAEHFKEGINTVSVTLNNHSHMYWTINDKKVVSTLYIDSNLPGKVKHKFDSFPINNKT